MFKAAAAPVLNDEGVAEFEGDVLVAVFAVLVLAVGLDVFETPEVVPVPVPVVVTPVPVVERLEDPDAVEEEEERVCVAAPIAKVGVVAKTSLMLPIFTACRV